MMEREILMQKYLHLLQIMETEKISANQLRTQLEEQEAEIERLKAEVRMSYFLHATFAMLLPPCHFLHATSSTLLPPCHFLHATFSMLISPRYFLQYTSYILLPP